jgi:hypothetical protein
MATAGSINMWPFSTIQRLQDQISTLQTEVWSAKQEAHELRVLLGQNMVELARHKQFLSGRTATMKALKETATQVK